MATFPQKVGVPDASTQRLISTIQSSYRQIVSEINGATNFGVANRKAILAQINVELTKLGVDVTEFLKSELPAYYKSGANEAVLQLKSIGAGVTVADGFNK